MDQSPSLPLFYKDPVLLRFEEHGDIGLAPASDFSFTREAVALPLCIGEFAVAQRHFPIVFAMDDQASAIALVGIRRGDNLFRKRDGSWNPGSYAPAYIRRYPFSVSTNARATTACVWHSASLNWVFWKSNSGLPKALRVLTKSSVS